MATMVEDICRNYGNYGRRYMPEIWQLGQKKYAGTMATLAEDICRNKEKQSRAAVVHLNFRAGSTFPVPVGQYRPDIG